MPCSIDERGGGVASSEEGRGEGGRPSPVGLGAGAVCVAVRCVIWRRPSMIHINGNLIAALARDGAAAQADVEGILFGCTQVQRPRPLSFACVFLTPCIVRLLGRGARSR